MNPGEKLFVLLIWYSLSQSGARFRTWGIGQDQHHALGQFFLDHPGAKSVEYEITSGNRPHFTDRTRVAARVNQEAKKGLGHDKIGRPRIYTPKVILEPKVLKVA